MVRRVLSVVATAVVMGAATVVGTAGGSLAGEADETAGGPGPGCAASFDEAARLDMEAFRDYDADTWRDLHHPGAETVLASGHRFVGIDAIMSALRGHFEGREAIFEWTELRRFVDDTCHSGFVVYETRYQLPSIGFDQSTTTTVGLVRERGEWKVVFDQGTELPAG